MLALDGLNVTQAGLVLGLPRNSVVAFRRRLRHRLGVKTMQEAIEMWVRMNT